MRWTNTMIKTLAPQVLTSLWPRAGRQLPQVREETPYVLLVSSSAHPAARCTAPPALSLPPANALFNRAQRGLTAG
ncbi:hypothetical protein [Streptomyces sp. NPDC021224]|uniref:hypothetical protein n=1 Tax=unclassified Streptomyces TaxID=2593676 RepID=UPI0037A51141